MRNRLYLSPATSVLIDSLVFELRDLLTKNRTLLHFIFYDKPTENKLPQVITFAVPP